MRRIMPNQPLRLKGQFSTVALPNQGYGELPPDFVAKFSQEIPTNCQLWDISGMQHYVTCNKNHVVPHFNDGWADMMNHYSVEEVKKIWFIYWGGGIFQVSVGNVLTSTDDYPSWHSLSTKPDHTTYFDVKLSNYTATSSQLTLQRRIGDHLRSIMCSSIILCNQRLQTQDAILILRGPPKYSSKIGSGWKQFCIYGGYKNGDTIRLKFSQNQSTNFISVIKMN